MVWFVKLSFTFLISCWFRSSDHPCFHSLLHIIHTVRWVCSGPSCATSWPLQFSVEPSLHRDDAKTFISSGLGQKRPFLTRKADIICRAIHLVHFFFPCSALIDPYVCTCMIHMYILPTIIDPPDPHAAPSGIDIHPQGVQKLCNCAMQDRQTWIYGICIWYICIYVFM